MLKRQVLNDGQFPVHARFYGYVKKEGFVPLMKLGDRQPTVFLIYETSDSHIGSPSEREYQMILIHNGKFVESTEREGTIYKYSVEGCNSHYEDDVKELWNIAVKLSAQDVAETLRAA